MDDKKYTSAALAEEKLTSELIYDGKVVHLYRDTVRLPNGHEAVREVVRHIGAVCVIPLFEDGQVLVERQFRYPHARVLLEIPAGKLDFRAEDRMDAARRELYEETGYRARELTDLGPLYTTPAFVDEVIEMYLARGLYTEDGGQHLDADEFLTVEKMHIDTLCEMVMRGEIPDAKTQIAVLKVKRLWDAEQA